MKKQVTLTEEQLQNVVTKAAKRYLAEMENHTKQEKSVKEKEGCCDKNGKKKITLSEEQLQNVVLKVANRMLSESHNTEEGDKEKTQKKYDVCERTKGGTYLCKKGLFDKNMKRISDWETNKSDAKK